MHAARLEWDALDAPAGAPGEEAARVLFIAAPSTATLAKAALGLVDLDGKLPPGVSPAQIKELASRFAMASIEHEGPIQQNSNRWADLTTGTSRAMLGLVERRRSELVVVIVALFALALPFVVWRGHAAFREFARMGLQLPWVVERCGDVLLWLGTPAGCATMAVLVLGAAVGSLVLGRPRRALPIGLALLADDALARLDPAKLGLPGLASAGSLTASGLVVLLALTARVRLRAPAQGCETINSAGP